MVSIMMALVVPGSLLQGWASRSGSGSGSAEEYFADPLSVQLSGSLSPFGDGAALTYLADWVLVAVAGVPIARVVGGWLLGTDVTAAAALRFTAKRWWVIAVAFVLIHIVEAIGFMLMIFPGVAAIVLFSLTSPVMALEELGPVKAMQRSSRLVRRSFSKVLGLMVLLALVSIGISLTLGTLPSIGAFVLGPERAWPLISVARAVTSIVLVPFTTAAMTLVYLDLRFRTEGLDLQLRANDLFPDEVTSA